MSNCRCFFQDSNTMKCLSLFVFEDIKISLLAIWVLCKRKVLQQRFLSIPNEKLIHFMSPKKQPAVSMWFCCNLTHFCKLSKISTLRSGKFVSLCTFLRWVIYVQAPKSMVGWKIKERVIIIECIYEILNQFWYILIVLFIIQSFSWQQISTVPKV